MAAIIPNTMLIFEFFFKQVNVTMCKINLSFFIMRHFAQASDVADWPVVVIKKLQILNTSNYHGFCTLAFYISERIKLLPIVEV